MLEEKTNFATADEMFDFFAPWGTDPMLGDYIFRGHSQDFYELVPTALRSSNIDWFWEVCGVSILSETHKNWEFSQVIAEYSILRDFYRLADQRGLEVPVSREMRLNLAKNVEMRGWNDPSHGGQWLPSDLLETAALAQHYGMPTRLLDWTYDIFVALYFALSGAIDKNGKLEIWALNKEYLSILKPMPQSININFITPPYAGNPNLNAQKGLFTHWPIVAPSAIDFLEEFEKKKETLVNRTPLNVLIKNAYKGDVNQILFKRFTLPCSQAKKGCIILSQLGYDAARIYPGYDGVAKQLLNKYKLKS